MHSRSIILGFCQTAAVFVQAHSQGLLYPLQPRQSNPNVSTSLTASDILGKGIEALGGQTALSNLKTVSYHVQYVFVTPNQTRRMLISYSEYRSRSLGQSEMPGVVDTPILTAGQQTISYDLSNPASVLQRNDWYAKVGDYWDFFRSDLDPVDATVVTKSGPQGYACYTKGNTVLFAPVDAPQGYVDGELICR